MGCMLFARWIWHADVHVDMHAHVPSKGVRSELAFQGSKTEQGVSVSGLVVLTASFVSDQGC